MAGIAVLDNMQRGLTALPGVRGIITVQNSTALPVRTTISSNLSAVIAHHVLKIIPKAKAVLNEADPHDSLQFLRIRGKNFEYLVVLDKEYTMISIQEHTKFDILGGETAGAATTGAMKIVTGADENANYVQKNRNTSTNNANFNVNNAAAVAKRAGVNPRLFETSQRRKSRRSRSAGAGTGSAVWTAAGAGTGAGAAQSAANRRLRGVSGGKKLEYNNDADFLRVNFLPRQ